MRWPWNKAETNIGLGSCCTVKTDSEPCKDAREPVKLSPGAIERIEKSLSQGRCIDIRPQARGIIMYDRSLGLLKPNDILNIETDLARGWVVEVQQAQGGLSTHAHPPDPNPFCLPYPMPLSATEPVTLIISAQADGDMPVEMHRVRLPPGYFLEGIKGYSADGSERMNQSERRPEA